MTVLYLILPLLMITFAEGATTVVAENSVPGPGQNGGGSQGVGGLYSISGNPATYHGFVGQSFIALDGGYLRSASFVIINHSASPEGDPLEFWIVPVLNGAFGPVLSTSTVDYADVPRTTADERPYNYDYTVRAMFNGDVLLQANQQYALFIGSLGPLGSYYRIWSPSEYDSYPSGLAYENTLNGIVEQSYQDLFFQISVESIPEPSVAALICLFAGAFPLVRQRRDPRFRCTG